MRAEPERYRSGHNGADSKSDGRVKPARGFESHPLRHAVTYRCEREPPSQDIFRAAAAARGWETTALHFRLAASSTLHARPRRTPRRTSAADVPPASR